MKRFFTPLRCFSRVLLFGLLLFLCSGIGGGASSTFAQSTWRPIADSRPFLAVWMANASDGWAVSTGGGVSRTTDGGEVWTAVPSGVTVTLRGVWGSSPSEVWAVGDGGTIIRWDGSNWATVPTPAGTPQLNAIHGSSATSVWAVGDAGTVLFWNGTTWASQTVPNNVVEDLYGVWAAANGIAVAVGADGRGLRYNGSNWVVSNTGAGADNTMRAVWGSAANSVWAVGTGGIIRFWNGSAWAAQVSGTTQELNGIHGTDVETVWAVGDAGTLRFFDGDSWTTQDADTNQVLYAVDAVNANRAVAVGNRRTSSVWDGDEWEASTSSVPNTAFPAIWAADDDRVWFGGANGVILRWNGSSFINTASGTNRSINAIWGLDHSNIWAVGASGTILKWNGSAWAAQTSGVTVALNGVWGTSATQVWAVGANGTILRWDGTAWASVNSGATVSLNAVWARNSTNAWAVGQQGTLLKWTGSAWATQASGTRRNLLSVWGTSTSAWVGGAAGTLLKLNGTTWASQTTPFSGGIAALTGTSATAIWAGAGAQIIRSNGTNWSTDGSTNVGLAIVGAFALSPSAIYLSTNTGVLFSNQPEQVPQISVARDSSPINTGEGVLDFASVEVTQSTTYTLTVTNTGNLALSGLAVSKDGTHPADFQIGTLTSATLDPAESLTLTVTFAPSNKGLRTANLRLASNDPTEPSFLIHLSGTGFFNSVTITQQPSSTAVAVGTPVALQVAATGTELIRYQWRRNGVTLKGATSPTLLLPSTTTSQSGSYSVVVSNPAGSVTSLSASLAVADINLKTVALPTGATLRLAAPVSGTVSSYLWRQGSAAIPDNPHFTGWASKTLQITRLTEADAARYACDIVTPGGPLTTETQLIVYNAKPIILTPGPTPDVPVPMPDAIVGGSYADWPVPINTDPLLTPTSYSASGLPTGLTIHKSTGIISGVPAVALTAVRDYTVTLTSSNAKGRTTAKASLRLHPLPANTVGSYAGPVARVPGFYSGLGGRIDLTLTTTGSYSGKLVLAGSTLSFRGRLHTSLLTPTSTATAVMRRTRQTDLILNFSVDPATQRLITAEVTDGSFTATLQAWRNLWALPEGAALRSYTGQFNLALKPPVADAAIHPQGIGFARCTVATSGRLTVSGLVADGTAFTCATFVGPLGEVLIYRQLYTSKGSISGHGIASAGTAEASPPYADSGITGTLQWSRPAQNNRTYRDGFGPIDLTSVGGRYLPPDKITPPMELIDGGLNTTNATLAFTEGGITDTSTSPDISLRIQAGSRVTLPPSAQNPRSTRLTLSGATGTTTGSFTLLDQNPAAPGTNINRTATHRGLIIREAGELKSYGFFLLARRPAAASTEKPTTTAILSGAAVLSRSP